MLIAKAESHLSQMKRDLNFFNQIQLLAVYIPYCLLSEFLTRNLFVLTYFYLQRKQIELSLSHWLLPLEVRACEKN